MKSSFFAKMNWWLMILLIGASLFTTAKVHGEDEEAPITVTGLLVVKIAEDLRVEGQEQMVNMTYLLYADNSITYDLQFVGFPAPDDLRTGQRITVVGLANGATLWVDTLTLDSNPPIVPAVGNRKAVILLVDFHDAKASHRYTTQQVADLMYSNTTRSVRDHYLQSSLGQLNFQPDTDNDNDHNPDVFGPFEIDYTYSLTNSCDYEAWAQAAETAASASINLALYQHRIFVLPHYSEIPACQWSGLAYVGCDPVCRLWITDGAAPMVYTHELGHNLGLAHAGTDPENDGIMNSEYGDYSDPMGGSRSWHLFGGPHVDRLGWYDASPGNILTVTQTGTYTLAALSATPPSAPTVPRVLKLQRPNNKGFYYLSYRQPMGYDDSLFSTYTQGVNIHRYRGPTAPYQTFFIKSLSNDPNNKIF